MGRFFAKEGPRWHAIWSGVLSFGLVSVPVELYTATEAHGPVFHQFEEGTADRIRYQRVNERTGDEVEYSDIVKGAEVGGDYVLLDQDELGSVAPGRSRLVDIHAFVDADDIDPLVFNKAYFLGPGGDETGKLYALLREAMEKADKAAIASFVMRGREYLAAVRADRGTLGTPGPDGTAVELPAHPRWPGCARSAVPPTRGCRA
jgi:DNA end-binding protein Ku